MPFRPSPRQPSDHHTDTFQTIPQTSSRQDHRHLPQYTTDAFQIIPQTPPDHTTDTFQTIPQTPSTIYHRCLLDHTTDTFQTIPKTPSRHFSDRKCRTDAIQTITQTPFRPPHRHHSNHHTDTIETDTFQTITPHHSSFVAKAEVPRLYICVDKPEQRALPNASWSRGGGGQPMGDILGCNCIHQFERR